MFSAGHLDTRSSQCSPHFPIPGSFFTQMLPNCLAYLWPSGRLLETAPSLHSLIDSLINYFTLIISIPSSLCLTHFLYKYSLWKKNLVRCSLDKACRWSQCFTVHSFASHFLLFVGKKKKKKSVSLPMCSWFSEESQWELVQRRFNSERVTPEEKSDVRKSGASPMGPWLERDGEVEEDVCPQQWESKVHSGTSWISINCQVLL